MKRLLVSGYYGFGNLGDEAVLEAILLSLKQSFQDVDITVLTANSAATQQLYGVKTVSRNAPFKILKALWECDVLISGGGSLLQDVTSHLSIFYYLTIIATGKMMGKKVMIYSQGIGPIEQRFNRFLTKMILGRVDAITVREPNSKKDLMEIGIKENKIKITADPVIGLSPGDDFSLKSWLEKQENYCEGKPIIGFAFRGKDLDYGAGEKLYQVMNSLRENCAANILLIPYYNKQDKRFLDELKNLAGDGVIPLYEELTVRQMIALTNGLDLLVGTRLHSLIVSAVCDTPMVAVSYDPKIEYFMKTVGHTVSMDIKDFEPEILLNEIKTRLENDEEAVKEVRGCVGKLRDLLHQNEEILSKLLN